MKVALSGNIGSGKSTIAKEFEKRGFYLLNYSERIKEEVAKAMTAVGITKSEKEASEKIHAEKEFYRSLLISWADACGWSDGSRLKELLAQIDEENIVLDNIRYIPQAKIVKEEGFITIKLEGGKILDIPSERSLDEYNFDITIPWMENIEKRMEYILNLLPKLQE